MCPLYIYLHIILEKKYNIFNRLDIFQTLTLKVLLIFFINLRYLLELNLKFLKLIFVFC